MYLWGIKGTTRLDDSARCHEVRTTYQTIQWLIQWVFASKHFVKVGGCASSSIPPSSPSLAVWKKQSQWQKPRRDIWTWVVLSFSNIFFLLLSTMGTSSPARIWHSEHTYPWVIFCWFFLCFTASWYPFWVHGLLVAKLKFLTVVFRMQPTQVTQNSNG